MTLLVIEGFDHYNDRNDLAGSKIAGWQQTTEVSFNAGRTGNALRLKNTQDWVYMPIPTAGDVFYVGFALKIATYNLTNIISFCWNPGVQVSIWVLADGSVRAYRGTTIILGTSSSGALSGTDWQYVEVYVKIANTGGEVTVKVDGTAQLTLTSQDTQSHSSSSEANGITLYGYTNNRDFDDLYICDDAGSTNNTFLGDCSVETLIPDGAGDSSGWTASAGSNYQCVDENPITDTDYVSTSTSTTKDLYTVGNLTNNTVTVLGVGVTLTGQHNGTGQNLVTPRLKTGTTDSASSTDRYLREDTQVGAAQAIWETDPDTTSAWTGSGVDGAQIGVELV